MLPVSVRTICLSAKETGWEISLRQEVIDFTQSAVMLY